MQENIKTGYIKHSVRNKRSTTPFLLLLAFATKRSTTPFLLLLAFATKNWNRVTARFQFFLCSYEIMFFTLISFIVYYFFFFTLRPKPIAASIRSIVAEAIAFALSRPSSKMRSNSGESINSL